MHGSEGEIEGFPAKKREKDKEAGLISFGSVALIQNNDYEPPEIGQAPAATKASPATVKPKRSSKRAPPIRVTRQKMVQV